MKNLINTIKKLFKKDDQVYYLIFMDKTPQVHFISKKNLVDVYNLVTETRMQQGTYHIIKGKSVL